MIGFVNRLLRYKTVLRTFRMPLVVDTHVKCIMLHFIRICTVRRDKNIFSATEIHLHLEKSACDPFKYTAGSPIHTDGIVSICMGKDSIYEISTFFSRADPLQWSMIIPCRVIRVRPIILVRKNI